MISADALSRTHRAAFAPVPGWSTSDIQELLDRPGTILSGDARAFLLVSAVAGEAEVLTIATHPDHQRQGLARKLLQNLPSQLPQDITTLFLEVASDNAAAQALYVSEGFAEIGRRKGYYRRQPGQFVDALILRKTLQSA